MSLARPCLTPLISVVNLSLLHHRIIVPLFKMLDMLLSNGCFDMFAKEER